MLLFTLAMEFLVVATTNVWVRGAIAATIGIIGATVIFRVIRLAIFRLDIISLELKQGSRGATVGLAVGLIVSITCGLLFCFLHGEPITGSFVAVVQPVRFLQNLGPALIEEASMRAGVVHMLNGLHGPWAGLAGGSLPFGLLHLFGRIFGNPVGIPHVIGTTASGLLLSILYLRFGFWAALSCHWIWNSLAGTWVRYAGVTSRDGMQQFEGAVETVVVLVIASACLLVIGDKRWLGSVTTQADRRR
ncbi:MAG: CPBP family glutamic-type intramembrane protease [Gammaproteobacteria bacterium]|nr:CPBP family glutamic-type intramembrane protease [Gammaproteobacteria bacterium]MDP6673549.1 CPBP family glutamic-type intramembrane protease [Gammaproteobacteria bacterium]